MRFSRFLTMFCARPMREHNEVDDVMVLDGCLPPHWSWRELEPSVPPGFRHVPEWSNGFREVWTCDAMRATITYCEGDVSVAIALSDFAWAGYKRHAREFYLPPAPEPVSA